MTSEEDTSKSYEGLLKQVQRMSETVKQIKQKRKEDKEWLAQWKEKCKTEPESKSLAKYLKAKDKEKALETLLQGSDTDEEIIAVKGKKPMIIKEEELPGTSGPPGGIKMSSKTERDLLKIIKEKELEIWKLKDENVSLKFKMLDISSEKSSPRIRPLSELETRISQLEKENLHLTILLERDTPNDHGEWLSYLERLAMIETQDTDDPFFDYSYKDEGEGSEIITPKKYEKWEFFPEGSSTDGMR